ncbi:hypothetical protein RRG08_036780 [Elysia crispata]|uniref:Uncharacterized protein n=1 Tax=Elysia crispata TaxID=231223 RepID=A0AAE1ACD1_9GAST|nr:hypothetical protein RRG08_036780 [Elysia crispata]
MTYLLLCSRSLFSRVYFIIHIGDYWEPFSAKQCHVLGSSIMHRTTATFAKQITKSTTDVDELYLAYSTKIGEHALLRLTSQRWRFGSKASTHNWRPSSSQGYLGEI